MKKFPRRALLPVIVLAILAVLGARADDDDSKAAVAPGASPHYGPLGWLDHRSTYGQDVFPQPLVVDETDAEDNEVGLGWSHTEGNHQGNSVATAELAKGFGPLTLAAAISHERDTAPGDTTQGWGSLVLDARAPFFQFVSPGSAVDCTLGAGLDLGLPTHSAVSQNTELTPKIFADLKWGDHLTVQAVLGRSTLYGGGSEGGLHALEYGLVAGYRLTQAQMPLPGVRRFTPMVELSGERELNGDDPNRDQLTGVLGFRLDLPAMGDVQPQLGLGLTQQLDGGARATASRGVVVSLEFDY
jgi:hypothetical protein